MRLYGRRAGGSDIMNVVVRSVVLNVRGRDRPVFVDEGSCWKCEVEGRVTGAREELSKRREFGWDHKGF